MKTITISDQDYANLKKLGKVTRLTVNQVIDTYAFEQIQDWADDLEEFLCGMVVNNMVYDNRKDAQAVADFITQNYNEKHYVKKFQSKYVEQKGFMVTRECGREEAAFLRRYN